MAFLQRDWWVKKKNSYFALNGCIETVDDACECTVEEEYSNWAIFNGIESTPMWTADVFYCTH